MNCPKCNYDNADDALFCANCGAKLEAPGPYTPIDDANSQLPVYGADQASQGGTPYGGQQPAGFPNYGQAQQSQPQNGYGNYSGYTPAQQSYNPNGYNGYRPGQERDWAAIAALVCGILALPCCFTVYGGIVVSVCAVVFGIVGIKSSKKAMAIVGLCLGAVGLVCAVIMIATSVSLLRDPAFMDELLSELEGISRS